MGVCFFPMCWWALTLLLECAGVYIPVSSLFLFYLCDTAAIPAGRAYYGEGTGSIFLDNVGCTGTEESLLDCVHGGVATHNCDHYEDAGVYCQRESDPAD